MQSMRNKVNFSDMNKITRKKNSDYTVVSNVFLRDKNLSIKAKGFLAVVMGLPDNWEFTINGICSILKEGKTAVYNAINELKDAGYCKAKRIQNGKGIIQGYDYSFFEMPQCEEQDSDNPHAEKPHMDNQSQLSKEEIKYETNKEERDKSLSKKDAKDELFEECWKAYQRKGSKAKSKPYWDKLTEGEKALVKLHIPAYVVSVSEKKYIKDFERYLRDKCFNNVVYKGNAVLFDPEQMQNEGEYHPVLDGFNLMWVESEKCYMTPFDLDMLVDGYTKENRPASAMVMKNGIRYIWDKEVKQWKVKR